MTTNHSRRVEAVAGVLRALLKAGIMPDGAAALAIQVDPATRELEELRAENERLWALRDAVAGVWCGHVYDRAVEVVGKADADAVARELKNIGFPPSHPLHNAARSVAGDEQGIC